MATIDLSQTGGKRAAPRDWLRLSATFCFLSIAAGQLLFTAFILLFYYPPSLSGDFAAWNAKPLIKGFVPGDPGGNLFFAAHVLMALLILLFGALAWRDARARRFAAHRRWTLRLFAVASAVWFMRVGYMAWGIAAGGAGIGTAMDGPFDIFLAFANSLLPLGVTELYLRTGARSKPAARSAVTALLATSALVILVGSAGAWLMMWRPYL